MKKIHLPKMISVELLFIHPRNPQKQNKHEFKELRKSIKKNGFDESLLVYPREDGIGYWIIAGNHRYLAAKAEGYEELPCVIRDDLSLVEAEIEVARRNYVRGHLDQEKFVKYVDHIAEEHQLSVDSIYELMGFKDLESFAEFYQKEQEKEAKIASQITKSTEISMVENLGDVLSHMFEQYGHTVPNSFIIFPVGKKKHMYIEATPALKKAMQDIALRCVKEGLDINVALGGLLQIGIQATNFIKGPPLVEEVKDVGTQPGPADIVEIEK